MSRTPEHNRARFLALSEARLAAVEHQLRLIGNLSSRVYVSTPEEVDALFTAIRAAVDAAETKFNPRRTTHENTRRTAVR